ncbi:MAG TPA: hypothetical protein VGL58_13845 [Caulobacteraceae bacterium]
MCLLRRGSRLANLRRLELAGPMPFSVSAFDQHVAALIERMRPKSILDIGPGAGKYGKIVKALRESGVDLPFSVALEVDPSYIEAFKLNEIYDSVQLGDASSLPDIGADAQWDLVILGDVLEHFRKSRGVDLVDYLYYRTKYIILVIPVDYIQGAWQGHDSEAHLSTWYPEDFARYKASCFSSGPGEIEIQLVLINGLRADPASDFVFARDLHMAGLLDTGSAPL